ncbi:c-type cytochrome [Corallococcus silvisoli]|uniref:c-type cytochrome n=1 Tax=Corallococcus silvisoli TaxID=2697031 RepID=UPI0013778F21|nr:cytochrome c [Corallococcus silvisoli]NBD09400.1 c-type cytochrome [Corallococcus silvisoli]
MVKKILLALGALVVLVLIGAGTAMGVATHKINKSYADVALPNIQRDSSPEGIARGEQVFRAVCAECHAGGGNTKPTGVQMHDFPPELGTFYSANITSDPEKGVGAWKDEEIARMVINAIDRDNHVRPMPAFPNMGDKDLAAVIGFMRSGHPDFAPEQSQPPRSVLTPMGRMVFSFAMGINDKARTEPVVIPAKAADSVEYGRYVSASVYDCVFCHSPGFEGSAAKLKNPDTVLSGGFEFDLTPMGGEGKLLSPNITPSETAGIGKWTLEEFKLAMKTGVTPGGYILRAPMPKYRYADDVELTAIYTFLRTMKANDKAVPPPAGGRPKAEPTNDPEKLFSSLGCASCHGANKQFEAKLQGAKGKPAEEVAKWIRNPESFKPGTQMPTYESLLDEANALTLAKYVLGKTGSGVSEGTAP